MATDFGGLVDAENGLISRCIFIEPEIYAQELEQIFGACWLFLYHETQIPQPGDFFTTYMGEDPILVRRMGSVSPVVSTLFFNFPLLRAGSRTFRVWHPRRRDKTEVWSWVYVDKAAPPDVKEAIGLAGIRGFGPSGGFEHRNAPGPVGERCRGSVLEHADGARARTPRSRPRCLASDFRMSESNHGQFYRRWAQLMAADHWAQVPTNANGECEATP